MVFSLVGTTLTAFWRIFVQAWELLAVTFGGPSGGWLVGAIATLGVAVLVSVGWARNDVLSTVGARVRNSRYFGIMVLIGLAAFLVVTGHTVTGYGEPRQLLVYVVLLGLCLVHLGWFAVDLASSAMGWQRGMLFINRVRANRVAYYMLLPSLLLLAVFLYTPAITIFYYSLHAYDLGGRNEWIGLGNYIDLYSGEVFWKSAGNMITLTVVTVILLLIIPLIVAELIFHLQTERMRYYLRAAFLVPMVVPGVIIFLIWGYFYSDAGLIPLFGHSIGLGDRLEGLLSRPQTALYALIFVGFPFVAGVNLLIFYAGLGSVDESVWEAAKMDGASALTRFFRIDVPLLTRQFKLLLILGIIGGVQAFENVLVMTQGGPGWQTMLPGLYMYRSAMSFSEYGYACAIGVTLFIFVLVISLAVNRAFSTAEK
jgi:raffinose/stachyose/melibiose transport system permease protein